MAEDLEAAGTTMEANLVDHITEMVIMTALDKTAVTAVMAEEAVVAAGLLKMDKEWNVVAAILEAVEEAATMASTTIPVGRNRHVVNETIAEAVVADGGRGRPWSNAPGGGRRLHAVVALPTCPQPTWHAYTCATPRA